MSTETEDEIHQGKPEPIPFTEDDVQEMVHRTWREILRVVRIAKWAAICGALLVFVLLVKAVIRS